MSGPKEHIVIPDCGGAPFEYYVAPNGTFELFPQESNRPATFAVNVQDGRVRWSATENDYAALVYVADPSQLNSGGAPIVWQELDIDRTALSANAMAIAVGDALQAGKTYLAVVVLLNNQGERIAFGSKSFQP